MSHCYRVPVPCCPAAASRAQGGFSLIEISIVTAIIMLIAIVGIPSVQSYVIENKVPRVAEERSESTRLNSSHIQKSRMPSSA